MPLEVRELVIQVQVGASAPAPAGRPGALGAADLAALRQEILDACLAELRQQLAARDER